MFLFDGVKVPRIDTDLPGPKARALLDRDAQFVSPSYTRIYPLVVERGSGAVIEDVDGNLFLDFTAGIAVTAAGHCHPHVVAAIQDQAGKLLHMSGTDFYYLPQIELSQRLAEVAGGVGPFDLVHFGQTQPAGLRGGFRLALDLGSGAQMVAVDQLARHIRVALLGDIVLCRVAEEPKTLAVYFKDSLHWPGWKGAGAVGDGGSRSPDPRACVARA